MAIMAVAMGVASRMWVSASQTNSATEELARATILGQLIMESRVRVVPYDEQANATGTDAESGLTYSLTLTALTPSVRPLRKAEVVITTAKGATVLRLSALTAKEF